MIRILLAAGPQEEADYARCLPPALAGAGITAEITTDPGEDPAGIDFIVYAPASALQDFTPFRGCRLVQSLWAGVERIVGNSTLTMPLCRMVDPGLAEGMVEYVTGHVLRHHLGMDRYIHGTAGWQQIVPPLARERRVAVLGLGELGLACARALQELNFDVAGWARTPKPDCGIPVFQGEDGLRELLGGAEITVLLLPRTAATENLMNAERLSWLPRGAVILNPGRGVLIDDAALLAALEHGQIGHATLDVFRTEPLPPDHPFRAHPRITVTPHIAAATRPVTAARVVAGNIRRALDGAPLQYLVNRTLGY